MSAQHTPGPLFQVQTMRYGKVVAVGNPCSFAQAQADCDASYRADWERTGHVTPTTQYVIAEAPIRVRICPTCDLPPISDCKFANCKREFAALPQTAGSAAPQSADDKTNG